MEQRKSSMIPFQIHFSMFSWPANSLWTGRLFCLDNEERVFVYLCWPNWWSAVWIRRPWRACCFEHTNHGSLPGALAVSVSLLENRMRSQKNQLFDCQMVILASNCLMYKNDFANYGVLRVLIQTDSNRIHQTNSSFRLLIASAAICFIKAWNSGFSLNSKINHWILFSE